jgi:hypothetical protein
VPTPANGIEKRGLLEVTGGGGQDSGTIMASSVPPGEHEPSKADSKWEDAKVELDKVYDSLDASGRNDLMMQTCEIVGALYGDMMAEHLASSKYSDLFMKIANGDRQRVIDQARHFSKKARARAGGQEDTFARYSPSESVNFQSDVPSTGCRTMGVLGMKHSLGDKPPCAVWFSSMKGRARAINSVASLGYDMWFLKGYSSKENWNLKYGQVLPILYDMHENVDESSMKSKTVATSPKRKRRKTAPPLPVTLHRGVYDYIWDTLVSQRKEAAASLEKRAAATPEKRAAAQTAHPDTTVDAGGVNGNVVNGNVVTPPVVAEHSSVSLVCDGTVAEDACDGGGSPILPRCIDGQVSVASQQSPIQLPGHPKRRGRKRSRKQSEWKLSRKQIERNNAKHLRDNDNSAKKRDGGSRHVLNRDVPNKGGVKNDRTCLMDAIRAIVPPEKDKEKVYGAMISAMASFGDTKISAIEPALADNGLMLDRVSRIYNQKGGYPFHLLQEHQCRLLINIKLINMEGAMMSHFVAWDGKTIHDHPISSVVGGNSTDRADFTGSKAVFNKLYRKFKSWQITNVYRLAEI